MSPAGSSQNKGTCFSNHLHGKHIPNSLQRKAGKLCSRHISFHCISLQCIFFFKQIEGLWQTNNSVIFPTTSAHFMSLSHILVILALFQTIIILLKLLWYLLWWSVISDFLMLLSQEDYNDSMKVQMMVSIFFLAIKYFSLRSVHCFVRHHAIAHLRDYSMV